MSDAPKPEELPPGLRYLKGLVTVLTATMILGLVVIVALLVIRVPGAMQAPVLTGLPETIMLGAGMRAVAFTQTPDWFAVVTDTDEILIFDRATGILRQTVKVAN